MHWWQAMILGIVEGLTEYLPISSTGHLILAQRVMGLGVEGEMSRAAADAYAVTIQGGAIVAVLGLYARHVRQMGMGLLGRDDAGLRLLINIVAAFLPAAILGIMLHEQIKSHLFGIGPVVVAWFVGGVAILAVAWWRRAQGERAYGFEINHLTWKHALIIGFAQCLAMWPGTSRSLVTIVGGVLVGMNLRAAVEFSFLLGVLTLGAATCLDAQQHGQEMLQIYDASTLAIGFVCAFASAVVAVKWFVHFLNRHGMEIFGYYRVALALVVGTLMLLGYVQN